MVYVIPLVDRPPNISTELPGMTVRGGTVVDVRIGLERSHLGCAARHSWICLVVALLSWQRPGVSSLLYSRVTVQDIGRNLEV